MSKIVYNISWPVSCVNFWVMGRKLDHFALALTEADEGSLTYFTINSFPST